jgi:hypothetical protein
VKRGQGSEREVGEKRGAAGRGTVGEIGRRQRGRDGYREGSREAEMGIGVGKEE